MNLEDEMIEKLLANLPQTSIRLGLERIEGACAALGSPQGRYPSVLVAGTNGKGSTSAFLASILGAAGKRVGLYTSPHLISPRERIRIGGEPIAAGDLERAAQRLLAAWPAVGEPDHPDALSYFEVMTALALDAFAHAKVDVAILEVGLGGRLDATNLSGTKLCAAVITKIALDHQEFLGDSLAAIAKEKGAIAREGVPLIVAPQEEEALLALREQAAVVGAPLVAVGADVSLFEEPGAPPGLVGLAGASQGVPEEAPDEADRATRQAVPGGGGAGGPPLRYCGSIWQISDLRLGLLGPHQIENAGCAVAALEVGCRGLRLGPDDVRRGLASTSWPGRLEIVSEQPLTVLDGAHNPDGARALARAFGTLWSEHRPQIVLGILGEKDRRPILEALAPLGARFHLCPVPSSRAVPPEVLAAELRSLHVSVEVHPSVEGAIAAARAGAGSGGAVLIAGSLYLVGAARKILRGGEV